MNVILDIDETFVQYVGIDDWAELPPQEQSKYETGAPGRRGIFVLRPGFREFFTFLKDNAETINLWTWSDMDYAGVVKNMIEEKVPGVKISNVWADTDVDKSIELHGNNKDLNYIWYEEEKFQPCDTILIDDLPANTQNPSNIKNGIQIAPFHPLGEKTKSKTATKIRTGIYTDLAKDDTLKKVTDKLRSILENPDFCSEGDMPFPLPGSTKIGGKRRKTQKRKQNKRKTSRR